MTILIGFIISSLVVYMLINFLIQFSEITFVNLFRIKQFVAYIIAVCFCIMPYVVKTEEFWVFAIFSFVLAVYFFFESYIARDDFFAWLETFEEDDQEEDVANNEEKK